MELVELKIQGISYSDNTSGAFALILDEINGSRKLPIVIGGFEAQAIAIALEKKIKTSRPLTHELFQKFADNFDIKLNHIIIYKLVDGVFHSNIFCEKLSLSFVTYTQSAGCSFINDKSTRQLILVDCL